MRIRTKLATIALSTGLAVGGFAGFASPAQAALTGDTIATFTITAGALAITVPASTVAINTGTVATGAATASGQLGSVTVADARGALVNSWTTSVDSTTFVLPGATPTSNETVAVNKIAYSSGAFTAHSGLGVFVPGTLANGAVPGTAGSYTGAAGNSSTTWNPTLTFTLLSSQVAGTYTGTVTHSVA
jgi:hypothetical protein